jgi:hypothetical protein
MKTMLSSTLLLLSQLLVAFLLATSATVAKAECSGCLCPGNPMRIMLAWTNQSWNVSEMVGM